MIRKPASASGCDGREHEVERQRRRAAGLEQQQPAQLVALALEVLHLLEHRRAGDVEHAADDDPARLSLGVGVDAVDDPAAHAATLADRGIAATFVQRALRAFPASRCVYGRALAGLLIGTGWAGTLGGLALCVLIFLSAYVAFDDDGAGVEAAQGRRSCACPRCRTPRSRGCRSRGRRAGSRAVAAAAVAAAAAQAAPAAAGRRGARPACPRRPPRHARRSDDPAGARRRQPARRPRRRRPSPAARDARRRPGEPAAAAAPPPPTLGDTTREVVGAVGTEVGRDLAARRSGHRGHGRHARRRRRRPHPLPRRPLIAPRSQRSAWPCSSASCCTER